MPISVRSCSAEYLHAIAMTRALPTPEATPAYYALVDAPPPVYPEPAEVPDWAVSLTEVRQALAAAALVAADAQEAARIVHAVWWLETGAAITESVAGLIRDGR